MIVEGECDSDCDDEQEDGNREQEVDRRQHPQDQGVRAGKSEYSTVNIYNFSGAEMLQRFVEQKNGVNTSNLKVFSKRTDVYRTCLSV